MNISPIFYYLDSISLVLSPLHSSELTSQTSSILADPTLDSFSDFPLPPRWMHARPALALCPMFLISYWTPPPFPLFPPSHPIICTLCSHRNFHVIHIYMLLCMYIKSRNYKWEKTCICLSWLCSPSKIVSGCIYFPWKWPSFIFMTKIKSSCVSIPHFLHPHLCCYTPRLIP